MAEQEAGRELDALIAEKVMGWQWFTFPIQGVVGGGIGRYLAEIGIRDDDAVWAGESSIVCVDAHRDVPHYSTDIAAAFQILEKLQPHCDDLFIGVQSGVWEAEVTVTREAYAAGFHTAIYSAPTPALAICRAALACVTASEPK